MKLYGNIKSERASKGQGGNEYLEIEILNEEQNIVALVQVIPDKKIKISISNNPEFSSIVLGDKKKCECGDSLCAKCLLINCLDDNCKIHSLIKKKEFRELYKKR